VCRRQGKRALKRPGHAFFRDGGLGSRRDTAGVFTGGLPPSTLIALIVVQALLIIGLSRLLGFAARLLLQPMVMAEIVAGIALGPSLLGEVWPSASATLFPPAAAPALGVMSQFGLILFMFTIGVDFDPKLLRGRGRASVMISHTSIIVPFALGALLAHCIHAELSSPGVPQTSFTLFLGAAMSITAFPVLARILSERGLLDTQVGAVALACAAVDDVTAWCILAFVVAAVRYTGMVGALTTTALAVGYVSLLLTVARPILDRMADRVSSRGELTEDQVALVWFAALLSAALTEWIGIHALFGAFAFGAVIPSRKGLSRMVAEKTGKIVLVLLLPLFFAYSGLRTEIGLLQDGRDWALCGIITLVACVGKFGGSMAAAKLSGMPLREATAIGILMNTRGLMEVIILNIGLDLGVISPKLFAMMVLMALFTTFVTTPLLRWVYPAASVRHSGSVVRDGAGLGHAA
jgi:Kef-type K+ transport system membrane component KefB